MIKVLHVVNVSFVLPYFFGEQFQYMQKQGYEVHLICSPSLQLSHFAKQYNLRYKSVSILRHFSIFSDLVAVFKICIYIHKYEIDIVNGHTPKAGLLAMCAAFLMRVPIRIYFRHGLLYETASGIKRTLFVNAEKFASFLSTKIVCVSPYLIERSICDHLSPSHKMKLLNKGSCNGVDVYGQFNPENIDTNIVDKLRIDLGLPKNAWIVGFTGRLVKDKGLIELIQAFGILEKKYANLYLLLVGPEESRDDLPPSIKHLMLSNKHIVLTGYIEKNIEYYYSLMNVLVLATHREGFGTSILEASSMQIPILTTNYTGSRDAVVDGVTGIYIDGSVTSISEGIKKLYENKELAKRLGINGRKFVIDNFDQRLIWKEIKKLY